MWRLLPLFKQFVNNKIFSPNKIQAKLFGLSGLWTDNGTQDTDYFLISTHSLRACESATAWTTRI